MKKRILAVLLSAAMALSLIACSNGTGGKEPGGVDKNNGFPFLPNVTYPNEGDFEIEERDDGVAIVRYLNYDNTDVEIPPTIGGKKVVEIGDNAFNWAGWKNITIPDGVTKFGRNSDCDRR